MCTKFFKQSFCFLKVVKTYFSANQFSVEINLFKDKWVLLKNNRNFTYCTIVREKDNSKLENVTRSKKIKNCEKKCIHFWYYYNYDFLILSAQLRSKGHKEQGKKMISQKFCNIPNIFFSIDVYGNYFIHILTVKNICIFPELLQFYYAWSRLRYIFQNKYIS